MQGVRKVALGAQQQNAHLLKDMPSMHSILCFTLRYMYQVWHSSTNEFELICTYWTISVLSYKSLVLLRSHLLSEGMLDLMSQIV